MALDPDVAGDLGRYISLLSRRLEELRERLGKVRSRIRLENLESELLGLLTAEEQSALEPFMQERNLAELQAERQLLVAQRDALVKAIGLLEAKLRNG